MSCYNVNDVLIYIFAMETYLKIFSYSVMKTGTCRETVPSLPPGVEGEEEEEVAVVEGMLAIR